MRERQDGQATVELVGLLPCVVAVLAAVWQLVLAGDARWSAATAARAAARAAAVGADAEAAARRHLPRRLERGLRVSDAGDGRVRVTLAVPAVIGGLRPGDVRAEASFAPQEAR
jgi:hypothetical protein